ncbi:hypothetical protein C8T65DRAFT_267967 [Cerioporus squamosus]|nr:hypothetical protein C8T65DRAFT_267967 [Cerioporus squamosus]
MNAVLVPRLRTPFIARGNRDQCCNSRVHFTDDRGRRAGRGGRARKQHSLSKSSSVNRLRVNFQTMNAMRPINATPPDTERPMMVDLLMPLLLVDVPDDEPAEVADADAVSETVGVYVKNTVVSSPCAFVVTDAETVGVAGGVVVLVAEDGGGVVEVDVEVAVFEVDVAVSDVDVEVVLVDVAVSVEVEVLVDDVLVSVVEVPVTAVSVEVPVSVPESPLPKGGKMARGATGAGVGNARACSWRAAAGDERRRALTERRTRHRARDREVNIWSSRVQRRRRGNYTSRRCIR